MTCSSINVIHLLHTLQRLLPSLSNSGNYSVESISQTQINKVGMTCMAL